MSDKWEGWGRLLAGLPYDVQAQLFSHLVNRRDLNPRQCYRLPLLFSCDRMTVTAGGTANSSWRFETLSAVYGVSNSFDNETYEAVGTTAGVSGLSAVYPSECNLQITFNQGQTYWIGGTSNQAGLDAVGTKDHVTRVDPIIAQRQDTWDIQIDGNAGLANTVYSRTTLHGVKIFGTGGAV